MGSTLNKRIQNTTLKTTQMTYAQQVTCIVNIAANHGPYRGNCLKKSLAIWWLLARKNINVELKIGVKNNDEKFQAHAWVEFMGTALTSPHDNEKDFLAFDYSWGCNRCVHLA